MKTHGTRFNNCSTPRKASTQTCTHIHTAARERVRTHIHTAPLLPVSPPTQELKLLLEQAGVNVSKGNKSAVLTSAADFIMDLQRRNEQLAAQDGQAKHGGEEGDNGGKVVEMGEAAAAAAGAVGGDEAVKMEHGDVVLLDNYVCQHGRNIFSGVRKHAVTWFK